MYNGWEIDLLVLDVKFEVLPIYRQLKPFTLQVFQQESIISLCLNNVEGSKL